MRQSEIVVYGKWSSQSQYLVQGPGNKAINGMRNALQDAKAGPSEAEGTQCPKGSDSLMILHLQMMISLIFCTD